MRGAGDGQLHGGVQAAGAAVGLALVVLDELGLVQHEHVPVERGVLVELQAEQRVGGDDDGGVADRRRPGRCRRRAWVSRMVRTATPGAKRSGLPVPVLHDAGGGDDQEPGVGIGLQHVQEQRQGLDGLAQAHVVGEDAAQAVGVQERQPVQALLLVVPQRGLQPGGRRHGPGRGQVLHGADALLPPGRLRRDHAQGGQLVPPAALELVDADGAPAVRVGQAPGLLDELPEAVQLGPVEVDPGSAVQHQVGLAPAERGEQAGELDRFVLHGHPYRQVEPVVALVVGVLHVQFDERVVGGAAQRRRVAGDLDGHVVFDEPRDDLREQDHGVHPGHGQVRGAPGDVDQAGQELGRQLEAGHHGVFGVPVPAGAER